MNANVNASASANTIAAQPSPPAGREALLWKLADLKSVCILV